MTVMTAKSKIIRAEIAHNYRLLSKFLQDAGRRCKKTIPHQVFSVRSLNTSNIPHQMLFFYYSIILVNILTSSKLAFAAPLPSQRPPDTPSAYLDLSGYDETPEEFEASQRGTVAPPPASLLQSSSSVRHRSRSPHGQGSGSGSGSGEGSSHDQSGGKGRRRGRRLRAEEPREPATGPNIKGHSIHYQNMNNWTRSILLNKTFPHSDIHQEHASRETFLNWLGRECDADLQNRLTSNNVEVVRAAMQEIVDKHVDRTANHRGD